MRMFLKPKYGKGLPINVLNIIILDLDETTINFGNGQQWTYESLEQAKYEMNWLLNIDMLNVNNAIPNNEFQKSRLTITHDDRIEIFTFGQLKHMIDSDSYDLLLNALTPMYQDYEERNSVELKIFDILKFNKKFAERCLEQEWKIFISTIDDKIIIEGISMDDLWKSYIK